MTTIEWTDETWNPVTGCDKVSPGCAHCYAEGVAARFWAKQYPPMLVETAEGATVRPRQFIDVLCHPERVADPLKWRKPRRVFVNSMSDLFHESVPDDFIDQVFATMSLAHQHTFQVLTKRPERMRDYMTSRPKDTVYPEMAVVQSAEPIGHTGEPGYISPLHARIDWPLPNVWLGVSVENQHFANERIPLLLQTPAAVRFISAEPLLGPLNLRPHFFSHAVARPARCRRCGRDHGFTRCPNYGAVAMRDSRHPTCDRFERQAGEGVDWVIVGGESGAKARPFDIQWARDIVRECQLAGVPVFVKQLGSNPEQPQKCGDCDPCLGGQRCYQQYSVGMTLRDRKGGDMSEWPADLRVREFPTVTR